MAIKRVKKIDRFPDLKIVYKPSLEGDVMGRCIPHQDTIEISTKHNTTQYVADKTLFHELVHYVLYQTGWAELFEKEEISEEGIVLMLENQLYHLISFTYEKDEK